MARFRRNGLCCGLRGSASQPGLQAHLRMTATLARFAIRRPHVPTVVPRSGGERCGRSMPELAREAVVPQRFVFLHGGVKKKGRLAWKRAFASVSSFNACAASWCARRSRSFNPRPHHRSRHFSLLPLQYPRDLDCGPVTGAARGRDAASIEAGCDGPQRLCAARLQLGNHGRNSRPNVANF